jgi:hypothetical protein
MRKFTSHSRAISLRLVRAARRWEAATLHPAPTRDPKGDKTMADYEFQSMLYRTRSDMLDAIAYIWAAPNDHVTELQESFSTMTDAALARDCIACWGLDHPDDDSDSGIKSHMAHNGYDAEDLAAAFADLRERVSAIVAERS